MTPSTCWKCNADTGSMLHIWWSCTKIQPFWMKVHKLITEITTYSLDYAPQMFLLHHSKTHIPTYKHSLAMHLVNAAKMCVPYKWRSTEPPTIKEWFHRIQQTKNMEDLIHQSKDSQTKFTKTWACWIHFTTTNEYKTIIT